MVPVVWQLRDGQWNCDAFPTIFEFNPYLQIGRIVVSGDGHKVAAGLTVKVVKGRFRDQQQTATFVWERVRKSAETSKEFSTWKRSQASPMQLRLGDINNRGEITGSCLVGEKRRAVYVSTDRKLQVLEPLGQLDNAEGIDINNDGYIVGYSDEPGPDGGPTAFIWHEGKIQPLGFPDAPAFSWANAINKNGDIAGYLTPAFGKEDTPGIDNGDPAATEQQGVIAFILSNAKE